jgi:hypothetical protein
MRRPALALFLALSAVLGTAAQAHAASFEMSVMQDDDQLIYSSAANRQVALNRMEAMGVDAVRVTVLWNAVAGKKKPKNGANPKAYRAANWDKYDDLVRAAGAHGIKVYFDVTPPGPRWSQAKATTPAYQRSWKPNAAQFERFYEAVATRFSGSYHDENEGKGVLPRVSWWGIGNEPNQPGWLMPQSQKIHGHLVPTSPVLYRQLLIAGATALVRTGHGDDTINMGETAPIGSPPKSNHNPLSPGLFIRELFCRDRHLHPYRGAAARARDCGSVKKLSVLRKLPNLIYAHHPYTKKISPLVKDKHPDSITMANLSALPALLDKVAAKTKLIPVGMQIALTEFGYETNPPDPFAGIPLQTQATWENLGDFAAFSNPRVIANTHFLLFDAAPRTQYPRKSRLRWFTYQSGLFYANGQRKPSATAYMLPFVVNRAAGGNYLFWGQVRFTPNGADQTIYLQRKDGGTWVNDGDPIPVTNSVGFWELTRPAQKGATYRELWVSPDGSGLLASREIKIT